MLTLSCLVYPRPTPFFSLKRLPNARFHVKICHYNFGSEEPLRCGMVKLQLADRIVGN